MQELINKFISFYPKGSVIFREGDPVKYMYYVQKGSVVLQKRLNYADKQAGFHGPGEIFGELALIGTSNRIMTATAVEDTELIRIDENSAKEMMIRDSDFMFSILKVMAERIVKLSDVLSEHSFLSIRDLEFKVVSRIIDYIKINFKNETAAEMSLPEFLEYIRENIDISKEKAVIVLERLQEMKIIILDNDRIILPNLKILLNYSSR